MNSPTYFVYVEFVIPIRVRIGLLRKENVIITYLVSPFIMIVPSNSNKTSTILTVDNIVLGKSQKDDEAVGVKRHFLPFVRKRRKVSQGVYFDCSNRKRENGSVYR